MDETRATAKLPGLDIELKRRVNAEEGAEYVSISLRATPLLEVFGAAAQQEAFNPFLVPLALWQGWFAMTEAFWRPFLPAGNEPPRLSKRS